MAARLTKRQADGARDAIKTSLLIKSLQDHVLEGKNLTASQARAAEVLLKKTLPDLRATEHSGPDGTALFPDKVGVIGRKTNGKDTDSPRPDPGNT